MGQYESAGVDYDVLDAAKRTALQAANQTTASHLAALGGRPLTESRGEPAFVFEAQGATFAAVLECLGTKSVLARQYADQGGPDRFHDVYTPTAAGRRVRARLTHGDPPGDAARLPWMMRFVDFDVLGHVNNAAYWAVVEEQLARRRDLRAPLRAVAEFRSGIRRDDDVQVLAAETPTSVSIWLVVAGDVRATLEVTA